MYYDFDCFSEDVASFQRSYDKTLARVNKNKLSLGDGITGLAISSGALLKLFSQYLFSGKKQLRAEMSRELGEMFYHVAIVCNDLGLSLADILEDKRRRMTLIT